MSRLGKLLLLLGVGCSVPLIPGRAGAASAEYNPVRRNPVSIGSEANRLIVGFRTTADNALTTTVSRRDRQALRITQASTSAADVAGLAARTGLNVAKSRQFTPSMHVIFLQKTLYGLDVDSALAKLRADPEVEFADVDQRRYPTSLPDDPLFVPTYGASGQWYMDTPSTTPITVQGVQTMDLAATDAVSAWNITTGSSGVVIADVDTGVRFDHPDLLRAGLGGRLLPGYDFVGQDFNPKTGAALGTFLTANDGDGWDPDPSDPGDWVSSTDEENSLFAGCGAPVPSSWHGTRVVGIFGAITNNDTGIAGMSWGSWILPVRALGKCGGYDSDIIAGMEWAAGLPVTNPDGPAVAKNPYPADIVNLSLGASSACTSAYQESLESVTALGVLVVVSAGNSVTDVTATSSVEAPANCSALVPGVIAVAGLRNVGTKVGYSSLGPEVGVSAPAGNCINIVGDCLRSIDTTTNIGTTIPGANNYTNETNENLGTSFSAPIVSGIAALMRSVNGNLTPAQLIARLEQSAAPFPANTANLPVCPNLDATTDECSCPRFGECGSGMVNALGAVEAAQRPIAAVTLPATVATGSIAEFDASGSAASCHRSVVAYAWGGTGGITFVSARNGAQVSILPGYRRETLTLTVTDSAGDTDTATIIVTPRSATSSAPSSAGAASSACPAALAIHPTPPTVSAAFSPATVGENVSSTLTITLRNTNPFALTQSGITETLPAGLTLAPTPAPKTTCSGAGATLTSTAGSVTLADANVPIDGSCTLTLTVKAAAAGTYSNVLGAAALATGPAGASAAAASATLTVTAPSSGGGALEWWDVLLLGGLLWGRRRP